MLPEAGGRANDSEEAIERADLETKQRRDAEDVWLAATFGTQRGRHDAVPDGVDDDVGHGVHGAVAVAGDQDAAEKVPERGARQPRERLHVEGVDGVQEPRLEELNVLACRGRVSDLYGRVGSILGDGCEAGIRIGVCDVWYRENVGWPG